MAVISSNSDDYVFQDALDRFIALGADIINTKPAERYGWQFNNSMILQPGFLPVTGPPKVVFIGINPSSNRLGQHLVDLDEERRLYYEWGQEKTVTAYSAAYNRWAHNNVRAWTVFKTIRPILEANGLSPESGDLGWLNIAKVPDSDMSAITEQIATRDFTWLKRQLRLMGPDIFVVLGSNASQYTFIARYLQQAYPNRVGVRGQRGGGDSVSSISERLRLWLGRGK